MPDCRNHRGAHPEDQRLWTPKSLPMIRSAVKDLSWLLSHGYAAKSSLKLVGDRYGLEARQREAVSRCACADERRDARLSRQLQPFEVRGQDLIIDGFNVITTTEVALSGGVVLEGRDGCLRDIAGIHGTYHQVEETTPALRLLGGLLSELQVASCCWLLDQPVSNSGRLRQQLLEMSDQHQWGYQADLLFDPDKAIIQSSRVAVSSDSGVLDACGLWFNLVRHLVESKISQAWVVSLGNEGE